MPEIITKIRDRQHFVEILQNNPGRIIIKFGAEWCGPCKMIEQDVVKAFQEMPSYVQCAMIDIDECPDVYAFLKSKKMVNGVPVLLCYKIGNATYIPDDIVVGADKAKLAKFFIRCLQI
jgi:thioredoxin 1